MSPAPPTHFLLVPPSVSSLVHFLATADQKFSTVLAFFPSPLRVLREAAQEPALVARDLVLQMRFGLCLDLLIS